MNKKLLVVLIISVLFFSSMIVTVTAKSTSSKKNQSILDPGGIRGPIFGRIEGHESGSGSVKLYAIRVCYLGIGHGIESGFYPRFFKEEEVMFYNADFKGIITQRSIFGMISGFPN